MIEFIKGKLDYVNENYIVIDVNNIGYELQVSAKALGILPNGNEEVKLYTYLHVKEDGISLFGFATREELNFFKLLITVSGIGPKGALSILSFMDVDDLRYAIMSDDNKAIARAPGIGAKTASKLIIELKDKIKNLDSVSSDGLIGSVSGSTASSMGVDLTIRDTVVSALVSLGYGATESMKAVSQIKQTDTMNESELLKLALKVIRQ